jgi:hypothetical protein
MMLMSLMLSWRRQRKKKTPDVAQRRQNHLHPEQVSSVWGFSTFLEATLVDDLTNLEQMMMMKKLLK